MVVKINSRWFLWRDAENIDLYDVIVAQGASTDSNYVQQYQLPGHFAPIASYQLLEKLLKQHVTKVYVIM